LANTMWDAEVAGRGSLRAAPSVGWGPATGLASVANNLPKMGTD
jgi:hypothetical protein